VAPRKRVRGEALLDRGGFPPAFKPWRATGRPKIAPGRFSAPLIGTAAARSSPRIVDMGDDGQVPGGFPCDRSTIRLS
jgi:hypothetical protein